MLDSVLRALHYTSCTAPDPPRWQHRSPLAAERLFDAFFNLDGRRRRRLHVCPGERISCSYNVGVIGMAM